MDMIISNSVANSFHVIWRSGGKGSSHPMPCLHKSCIRIFALTVTGPRNPMGSYIFEDSCKTSLLVMRFGVIEAADLAGYVIMSVVVFHSTPRTLASGQSSRRFSFAASDCITGLLEVHDHKLKPTGDINAHARL